VNPVVSVRRTILSSLTVLAFSAGLAASVQAAPQLGQPPQPVKKAAKSPTGFRWKVSPSTVEIFLDGKKLGTAKHLTVSKTKPGMHTVRLVNGEDEAEFDVNVKKGQLVNLSYEFTDV
jgi:hypothetical protein